MPNPNPHPEQFQDGVRWFQSLLLLAPLFGTSLRVPYPLVVGAQLCASLLSMHIFVHASRFEAYDGMGDDTTDATFAPLFYGNASSQQLSLYKPSTSSSMRVTLCAAATSAAKYAPPKLRCRAMCHTPEPFIGVNPLTPAPPSTQATPPMPADGLVTCLVRQVPTGAARALSHPCRVLQANPGAHVPPARVPPCISTFPHTHPRISPTPPQAIAAERLH